MAFNNVFGFFLTATLVAVMRGGLFLRASAWKDCDSNTLQTFDEKLIHGYDK